MTNGGIVFGSVVNGMMAGALGGWAAEDSRHPVLKGALVTGTISGLLTAILIAGYNAGRSNTTGQVSGPPAPRQMQARFP